MELLLGYVSMLVVELVLVCHQ